MRVWTMGDAHLVVRQKAIELYRSDEPPLVYPTTKREKSHFPEREVLAVVSRDPFRAWIGTGSTVALFSFGNEVRVEHTIDAHFLDAIGLDDGRVLACVASPSATTKPQRARLVVLPGDARDLSQARELELPKAPRIEWPGGIWSKGAAWPEDELEPGDEPPVLDALAIAHASGEEKLSFDPVSCFANEHGLAVTSAYSGLVLGLPSDASRVDFALRVPMQVGESEIFAARSAEGIVVVVCIDGRHSAILHLAPDGRVLAHRHKVGRDFAWGMGPPVVQGERVVVFESGIMGDERLLDISLSEMKVIKTANFGVEPEGQLSAASAGDTQRCVLGMGFEAVYVRRDGRGHLSSERLEPPPPVVERPKPKVPAGPPRAVGPASLALAKSDGPRSWETQVGENMSIALPFSNQGGKATGLSVEIAGPAVQAGLVVPLRVRVGETEAEFVCKGGSARVELPAIELVAGYARDRKMDKHAIVPESPVLVAEVELKGSKAGSSVLTVRVGPLGAPGGRGSVMQGKSLTVRAPQ